MNLIKRILSIRPVTLNRGERLRYVGRIDADRYAASLRDPVVRAMLAGAAKYARTAGER